MASDNVIIKENGGITVVITNDANAVNKTVVVSQAGNSINVTPNYVWAAGATSVAATVSAAFGGTFFW